MSQPGHDPHSYNPMTNQRHLQGAILLAINVNTDTSNQIDLYTNTRGTISACIFQQELIFLVTP